LAVTRIDRLARSSRDLLNIVHEVEARGATFESLTEPWANTNSPQAAAMLSTFAQLERAFILARTKEGRERARVLGRSFGPKFKLNQQQIAQARDLQGDGRGLREIAALLACSVSTVWHAVQKEKEEEQIA